MNIPEELKYTRTHEWVKTEDGEAVIGITDYAQDALGDLVFVNLPEEGDDVTKGEAFEELADEPQKMNEDPYGAWFIRVKDITDTEELLSAEEYAAFVKEEQEKAD